jgi:hypothetical protein
VVATAAELVHQVGARRGALSPPSSSTKSARAPGRRAPRGAGGRRGGRARARHGGRCGGRARARRG